MTSLPRTNFGNPILRKKAKRVTLAQLKSPTFKRLIKDMFHTVEPIGVGLAAPQVGKSLQLAVIDIHSLQHRPNVEPYKQVIINPEILSYSKEQDAMYEGCLSFVGLRAEAHRSKRIQVRYIDEKGEKHTEWIEGFRARVFQHEIDHLNGTLFVDRVIDTHTILTTEEYTKRVQGK